MRELALSKTTVKENKLNNRLETFIRDFCEVGGETWFLTYADLSKYISCEEETLDAKAVARLMETKGFRKGYRRLRGREANQFRGYFDLRLKPENAFA